MRLALYQPDIPQNTGTMLRTCACLDVAVDVIGPTGFDMSDRAFRRAGLDYLDHVSMVSHRGWEAFQTQRKRTGQRLILLTTKGEMPYTSFEFAEHDILMVGRESAGVPREVAASVDARLRIPILGGLRSLNVAVAAGMALGEALRQVRHAAELAGDRDRRSGEE